MDNYERYYRRSYNAINKLVDAYRNGYDKNNTSRFREELKRKFELNRHVLQSEFNGIMFTAMITLMGLNKEAIEDTGKIIEYKKNVNEFDLSQLIFTKDQFERLENFYKSRTVSTDFDKWLSIQLNPNTDKENIDYLRRVRNALLHSNFYLDEENVYLPFAKLKTKSYYEAELFNLEFQLFVFEYFGNIEALGLTEKIYTFLTPPTKIKGDMDLLAQLGLSTIVEISYDNLKTLGTDSPELSLKDSLDENCCVDVKKFVDSLTNNKNIDNMKCQTYRVSMEHIEQITKYIEKTYGKSFFEMDMHKQWGIICTHLKYELNPKIEISNWICHFWYLYASITNGRFKEEFLNGDEYGIDSCYPALMILKSYLIMYRLQNTNFDEIDYSKINFDIKDPDTFLYSENKDKSPVTENYYVTSFIKEKNKGNLSTDNEIINKIVCEVVRDSLAHGNVRTYIHPVTLEPMIELKDINPKTGKTRVLALSLSEYEIFLNSEAFKPAYCYKKEDTKTLIKK